MPAAAMAVASVAAPVSRPVDGTASVRVDHSGRVSPGQVLTSEVSTSEVSTREPSTGMGSSGMQSRGDP